MRLNLDFPDQTVGHLQRKSAQTGRSIDELVSTMVELSLQIAELGESDNVNKSGQNGSDPPAV